MSHTQGEWEVGAIGHMVQFMDGHEERMFHVRACDGHSGDPPKSHLVRRTICTDATADDARLIAAAPSLYEALKALLENMETAVFEDPRIEWAEFQIDKRDLALARSALARAESLADLAERGSSR